MTAKRRKILLAAFLFIVFIGWLMGQYDYVRLTDGKPPFFARAKLYLMDGGSVQYFGLGYTITDEHQMRWGIEMPPESRLGATNSFAPFRVGPRLDYWTPFVSREKTRFVIETNR